MIMVTWLSSWEAGSAWSPPMQLPQPTSTSNRLPTSSARRDLHSRPDTGMWEYTDNAIAMLFLFTTLLKLRYPDIGRLTGGWLGPLLLLLVFDVYFETQAPAVRYILEVVPRCQSHYIQPFKIGILMHSFTITSFTFLPLPLRIKSRALHVMLVSRKLINSGRSYNCADLSITPCQCHAGCACVNYAILAILGRSSLGSQCNVYLRLASCPGFLSKCIVESLTRIYICLVSWTLRWDLYFLSQLMTRQTD